MVEENIVLIDTDAGLDDALAIIMAVKAHLDPSIPFRIVGITCVSGNTGVDNVTVNVTKILDMMKISDIPIFRGAKHAMVNDYLESKIRHHGGDGFGDVDPAIHPRPVAKIENETAVSAIIRLANEYAGKLTIVALGPLTNIALAVRADDRISDKIKSIYLMGGSSEGRGNVIPCAEFNFHCDPESVHVILTSFKCPITIAPMELARKDFPQSRDWRLNILGIQNTPECEFLNVIEHSNLHQGFVKERGLWFPFDSTIVAALIEPSLVWKVINPPCWMELHGQHTRGQLVLDFINTENISSHVNIIVDLNEPLFQRMLIWALNSNRHFKKEG